MGDSGGIPRGNASAYEIAPGTMVGEYRIEGELGAGGMGKVYSAMHPVIAKRAAVKVLHPELSVNSQAVERFVQEARSVNQIGHPNIVDIFAFGSLPDGRSYFVMEWLRGESLRTRIDRSLPSMADTLAILETIAIALEAAHEAGIVHRDLKPDNVFLVDIKGAAPQVKLLDFGIAKLLVQDVRRSERTQTGNLMGTPAYISPEQARGYAVDHRTDVYALGAVAYEMLTGSLPFPADNAADMIAKHLFEEPPHASVLNSHVPPELDALVTAMLDKEADARPTLAAIREALRVLATAVHHTRVLPVPQRSTMPALAQHTPIGTQTTTAVSPHPTALDARAPRSRAWVIAAVALVCVVAGGGVYLATRDTESRPAPEEPVAPAPNNAATTPATRPEPTETRPAETRPAETKPAETTTTEPAPTTTEPATTEPTTTEPAPPRPGKRPKAGGKKGKPKIPPPGDGKTTPPPPPPEDPDAPM